MQKFTNFAEIINTQIIILRESGNQKLIKAYLDDYSL